LLKGGSGNDKLFGGNGADTLQGNAGDDVLQGDTAYLALVPGRGQVEAVTFASQYDKGDVLTITLNGKVYSYTVPAVGSVSFDAALFVASDSTTLSSALTTANISASMSGNIVTFTDADHSLAAGSFDLQAGITEVAATPATATYTIDALDTTTWSVTIGGTTVTSAKTTSGDGSTDSVLADFITALNTQYGSAATFSYDAATNSLVATGPADGSDLPGIDLQKTVYTTVPGGSATHEVSVVTVLTAVDGIDGGPDKVTGSVTLTSSDLASPIVIPINESDSNATQLIANDIDDYIRKHPELGLTSSANESTNVVTLTWTATGNKVDLVPTFTAGADNTGDIVTFAVVTTQGTGAGATETSTTTSVSGILTAGVQVSNQGDPGDVVTQTARDAFLQTQSNALDPDVLTGGAGSDTFVILHDQNINMLATGKFDTISDFNNTDHIKLAFGIDHMVAVGTMTGATLADAVGSLFAAGGALNGAEHVAGVFTYGSMNYLVIANDAGASFGNDDLIVALDHYVAGTLTASDFLTI
jgi:hypothetical protein